MKNSRLQIAKVTEYIHALRFGNKPSPPRKLSSLIFSFAQWPGLFSVAQSRAGLQSLRTRQDYLHPVMPALVRRLVQMDTDSLTGSHRHNFKLRFRNGVVGAHIIIIIIIIIMYIYHALINALSAHMIHINLNMIFYIHVKHLHKVLLKINK